MEIRRIRQERALSVRELARLSGLSRTTVTEVERGLKTPYPSTIRKLAAALGVTPVELMGDEEPTRDSEHEEAYVLAS